jgi:DNA-binding IclR family transcriptional regulator
VSDALTPLQGGVEGRGVGGSRTACRVVRLLEVLSGASSPLRLSELARQLDVPVSSTQVLLKELMRCGAVAMTDQREYVRGPRLVALGARVVASLDVVRLAERRMVELASEMHEYVYLALPVPEGIMYVSRVGTSSHNLRVEIPLGVARPLHATAAGQVYLAYGSPDAVERAISRAPLSAETPHTITDVSALRARIQLVHTRGYAVTEEESIEGVVGLSAPVRTAGGALAGALTISFFRGRSEFGQEVVVRRLVDAACDVSRALGWSGNA